MVESMELEASAAGLDGAERSSAGSGELFNGCGGQHGEVLEWCMTRD